MAAKLEADVSARVGKQKLILDSPAQPKALRNSSFIEDTQFEDLTKSFHQVLSYIKTAFSNGDPVNFRSSLKDAQELALMILNRYGLWFHKFTDLSLFFDLRK